MGSVGVRDERKGERSVGGSHVQVPQRPIRARISLITHVRHKKGRIYRKVEIQTNSQEAGILVINAGVVGELLAIALMRGSEVMDAIERGEVSVRATRLTTDGFSAIREVVRHSSVERLQRVSSKEGVTIHGQADVNVKALLMPISEGLGRGARERGIFCQRTRPIVHLESCPEGRAVLVHRVI